MSSKSATDVLVEAISSAAKSAVANAQFDVSSYGIVTSRSGYTYKIAAFGGEYTVTTNRDYDIGQKLVVTAMQKNFRNVILAEGKLNLTLSPLIATASSHQWFADNYLAVRPVHLRTRPALRQTSHGWLVLYYFYDQIHPGYVCAERSRVRYQGLLDYSLLNLVNYDRILIYIFSINGNHHRRKPL